MIEDVKQVLRDENFIMSAAFIACVSSLTALTQYVAHNVEPVIEASEYTEVVNYGSKYDIEKVNEIISTFESLLVGNENASIDEMLKYGAVTPGFTGTIQRFGSLLSKGELANPNPYTVGKFNNDALLALLELEVSRTPVEDKLSLNDVVQELSKRNIDSFEYLRGMDKEVVDRFSLTMTGISNSELLDIPTGLNDSLSGKEQSLGQIMIKGCLCESQNSTNNTAYYFKHDVANAGVFKSQLKAVSTDEMRIKHTEMLKDIDLDPNGHDEALVKAYLTDIYQSQGFAGDNDKVASRVIQDFHRELQEDKDMKKHIEEIFKDSPKPSQEFLDYLDERASNVASL